VGALAAAGVAEEDARWYATEAEAGRVVVTVHAADGAAAREILHAHGAGTRESSETAIPGNALPATPY
jgi:hypothetical protein